MYKQFASMARMPNYASLAPLDAESAETAEFNLRLPLHGPRNRIQHGIKYLLRLPGSRFTSQLPPQFLNEFCLVHKAASMKGRLLPVKRRRRNPIPAT